MLPKDKIILEDVTINTIDVLISSIDVTLWWPYLSIARGLSKALYGSALKLREQRAMEYVEFIRDNLSNFSQDIISTEWFQDGFVVTLEAYIKQRNREKRWIMQKIFLGFWTSENIEDFELERMLNTINVIWSDWLKLLWKLAIETMPYHVEYIKNEIVPQNIARYENPELAFKDLIKKFSWIREMFQRANKINERENDTSQWIDDLESIWIISSSNLWTVWWWMTYYYLTDFWFEFLDFIK